LHDLALNFDIDIEPYLLEYLKDIQTNDNECDNNNDEDNKNTTATTTQQTFATAAIKLQTSAGIYDCKVEYLHKSTYEVLDDLIQQLASTQQQPCGSSIVGRRGAIANNMSCGRQDVDVTAFNNYDHDMEFLLLDDVIPVDKSI
jgi:hypothetical protein